MVLCEFITWLVEAWVLLSFLACWLQISLGSLLPWGPPHGKRCHLLVLVLTTQLKAWHTMVGGAKRVWTPEDGSLWAFSEMGTPGRIHPLVSKGKWLWKELSKIVVPSLGDLFAIRGCFPSCTFFPMAWIFMPLSRFICWNLIPNVVVYPGSTSRKWLGHEGKALLSRINALIEEPGGDYLSPWLSEVPARKCQSVGLIIQLVNCFASARTWVGSPEPMLEGKKERKK